MIIRNIPVPTGNICIIKGDKGLLEFLSIGDYGKDSNIKADFLGITDEISGVRHREVMPLEKKWVITCSTQYGCSMGCKFCDVPKVGPGLNATVKDLAEQVRLGVSLHPEVKQTERLNLHWARMGEPTWNFNVIPATRSLKKWMDDKNFRLHPVVSTMMPRRNAKLGNFISEWIQLKNELMDGEAGLQLSIQSSCDVERNIDFGGSSMLLIEISDMMKSIIKHRGLKGRKIALNFAIDDTSMINADVIRMFFNPKYFMCKITPMHVTSACIDNQYVTTGGYSSYYPYKSIEEDLKSAGFDVLVFVPSIEEDESRITCGNAILSDMP